MLGWIATINNQQEVVVVNRPIVVVIGTRAEAIKLIPVYQALKKTSIPTLLCATFQHSELLAQVCDLFNVIPDFNLGIMKAGQDLFYLTQAVLEKTKQVYLQTKPKLVMVHGDTTTTMAAALSAFYLHIPIAHVEAGLRTGNMSAPFPEEMNRKVVGQIARYHFTPTALATANMLSEGVPRERVFLTGNTIVDALFSIKKKIVLGEIAIDESIRDIVDYARIYKKRLVLLTAHRRESFNGGLLRAFSAVKRFAQEHKNLFVIFPVHPNPQVKQALDESGLAYLENVHCTSSLVYKELVFVLMHAHWVVTDSGGIQEEAASLGKPVICVRDHTERLEGVWEGMTYLVGTDECRITAALAVLYTKIGNHSSAMLYGDGTSSQRIVSILSQAFEREAESEIKRESIAVHPKPTAGLSI